jgi:hypothetical protein
MNIKMLHFFLVFILLIHLTPVSAQNNSPPADGRTVKLSPKIRVLEREESIPTIPMEVIQHFLNRPKLISEEQIQQSSYILANAEESLLSTKRSQIYVTGIEHRAVVGSQYMIVKVGQLYRNPPKEDGLAGEVLAREAVYLGEAVLQKIGQPAVLEITDAVMEIKAGDLLVPLEKIEFTEDFYPHSPTTLTNAYIIAVTDDVSVIGQYKIVVVNQGTKQGLERGHILTVLKENKIVHRKDDEEQVIKLPPRRAGELLIFKVFKNVSYALVMSSMLPIQVFDQVSVP